MTSNSRIECERHVVTLGEGVTMAFRRIPACPNGFLMGSRGLGPEEEPIHRVVIPEVFWMGETPVTQAQFAVWTNQAQIEQKNRFEGPGNLPAETMKWQEANEFCDWLTCNFRNELPVDAHVATLPIEAMWEYACHGDAIGKRPRTDYYAGDGEIALDAVGWTGRNSDNKIHAVYEKNLPNDFGLCDMHGNVWERCLDRWDAAAYRRRWDGITARETFLLSEQFGIPVGDADDMHREHRVQRGGSYWDSASACRTAFRHWYSAGYRWWSIGFRVCLVRSPIISQASSASPERTASERLEGAEVASSVGEADEILNTNFHGPATSS